MKVYTGFPDKFSFTLFLYRPTQIYVAPHKENWNSKVFSIVKALEYQTYLRYRPISIHISHTNIKTWNSRCFMELWNPDNFSYNLSAVTRSINYIRPVHFIWEWLSRGQVRIDINKLLKILNYWNRLTDSFLVTFSF